MKKNNPIFLESILKFDVPIGICSNYVNLKKYTKNKNFDDINIRQWDIEIRQNHLIQEIVFANQNNSKILLKYNQRAGHILYHNLSAKNMSHDYIKSIFEPFL